MSPAARLKHAQHTLAGLLVPATWFALSGAARADEPAPATTTTTEAPATTTTTAAPAVTTTTAPLPKKVQKALATAAAAEGVLARLNADDDAAPDGAAAGPVDTVTDAVESRPAPPSISVDDVIAAFPGSQTRPSREDARAGASAAAGAGAVDPAAPGPADAEPGPFGIPTGDGPSSGLPGPLPSLAFTPSPVPIAASGGPGLISDAPAQFVDPLLAAALGGAPAAGPTSGPGVTGQGENPERGPPTAAITTGNATASGNQAVTTIDQTTMIAVTEKGTVSLTTAENRDTGAGWMSATLPSGLLGGHGAQLSAAGIGTYGVSGNGSATITTGDAIAVGNWSTTTINQKTMVAVTANGQDLVVDQPASVANVGTATATTGGNTALGTTNGGGGSAIITTGDASAYGNRSTTFINQSTMVAVTGSNSHVWINQIASVDNIGTATATTGDNTATGTTGAGDGTAVIQTGDARAVGNESTTTINQSGIGAVTGNGSTAVIDQQADVNNIGTATASTGGNAAVGASSGSYGSVLVTTGNADATGNTAQTTVTQRGISVATGRFAGISITQGAGVVNNGTAVATTGVNTAAGAG